VPRVKPYYKITVQESDVSGSVELMQDSIERVIGPLSSIEVLDGVLVSDIELSTTAKRVEHKLGRKPTGWILVNKNAAEDVFSALDVKPEFFLNLTATGTVTVSLWIF
jgi:hypothetical protein